jgi:hypothetical protein
VVGELLIEMKISNKNKIYHLLKKALEWVRVASIAAGPVDDAIPDDVTVCLHISNAAEDITAAMDELKNGSHN